MKRKCLGLIGSILLAGVMMNGQSLLVGFEDVSLGASATEVYSGGGVYHNGSDMNGGFTSEGVNFTNTFTDWGSFTSWAGWGYSTTSDVVTADFANQYSAFTGSALAGQVYGVAFVDPYSGYDPIFIDLPSGWESPENIAVTNTTYTALTLLNGNGFSTAFAQGDYFKLTIRGFDQGGAETGFIDHYLADFRGVVETHYVQDSWVDLDITSLGANVDTISFELESTDVGDFGMNTPAYFAIDNLVLGATPVPEPKTMALVLGFMSLAIAYWKRR